MFPWICLNKITCVSHSRTLYLYEILHRILFGSKTLLDQMTIIWWFESTHYQMRNPSFGGHSIDLFTLDYLCCDTTDHRTFSHFALNTNWLQWNEFTKWPIFGHLRTFVIEWGLPVSGSVSMDLFTQDYVCCDTADHRTFSHFPLNTYWLQRIELTKWPIFVLLRRIYRKFEYSFEMIVNIFVRFQTNIPLKKNVRSEINVRL